MIRECLAKEIDRNGSSNCTFNFGDLPRQTRLQQARNPLHPPTEVRPVPRVLLPRSLPRRPIGIPPGHHLMYCGYLGAFGKVDTLFGAFQSRAGADDCHLVTVARLFERLGFCRFLCNESILRGAFQFTRVSCGFTRVSCEFTGVSCGYGPTCTNVFAVCC